MKVSLKCFDQEYDQFIRVCFERAGLTVIDQGSGDEADHAILITSETNDPDIFKNELEKEVQAALSNPDSKVIVWNRIPDSRRDLAISLDKAINEVRYKELYNIRSRQFIKVVDDIRFILLNDSIASQDQLRSDIVFIYDSLEYPEAERIGSMLGTVLKLTTIEYNRADGKAVRQEMTAALEHNNFFVFYAHRDTQWMFELYEEMWEQAGGDAGKTHFLLTTDNVELDKNEVDRHKSQMICIEPDLLALEIKIQHDILLNGK